MTQRYTVIIALFATIIGCGGPTPQTKKSVDDDPLNREVDKEAATALLEEADSLVQKTPVAAAQVQRLELPETPEHPSRDIDGESKKDWKGIKSRAFKSRNSLQEGDSYWRGANDASFKVSFDSDAGFVYLLIEVRDDKVIDEVDGEVSDGIVLTLRDPNLDSFAKLMPEGAKVVDQIKAETKLLFLPDGRFRRWESDRPLPDEMGIFSVTKNKRGYTLELALQLEAFEQVSAIPMYDIAFRVEQLDGDEPDRPGYQTVMSMFPETDTDDARFALVDTGGVLPHYSVAKIPPRKNAIGAWRVTEENNWMFNSFEAIPEYWATIEDRKAFEEAIKKIDAFDSVCKSSKKELQLIEAYQSRGGQQRVGLIMCGDRTRGTAKREVCPAEATTEVIWTVMKPDGDGWRVVRAENVFGKKLEQCAWKGIEDKPFVTRLSLFPLDMQDPNMWAVGWTIRTDDGDLREDINGIAMLHGQRRDPRIGTALTREIRSTSEKRSRLTSKVYLTPVNDDEHLDLCQVEDVEEQYCDGVDIGCKTMEHGKTVLTTVQLYNPKIKKFERYEMSKHKNCTAAFDLSKREGYILMQTRGRVGFLPSPVTEAEKSDKLDLF